MNKMVLGRPRRWLRDSRYEWISDGTLTSRSISPEPTPSTRKTHTFHLTTFTISEQTRQFKTAMSRLEAIAVDDWPGVDVGKPALAEIWTEGPA